MIGKTLSHFRIVRKLGEGGMGVVYHAVDTKLERDVAIKLLPAALASDPDRLGRLEKEARVLATLNHPGIASIHDLADVDGNRCLVLEMVPGKDLSEMLEVGPLPLDEAIGIMSQMAEALDAAHEKGIIHRDLKPANIKVTPDGKVKILDFGLAEAIQKPPVALDHSQSPTVEYTPGRDAFFIGTVAYMSPEQARGKPMDRRTDIWAFGCLLYEALTGRQAFGGETFSDSIAAILEREPDWDVLPAGTPERTRELLRRCLQKDARRRLRDVWDARIELEESLTDLARMRSGGGAPANPQRAARAGARASWIISWRAAVLVALLAAALGAAIARHVFRAPLGAPRAQMHFAINLSATAPLSPSGYEPSVAISPDGRMLVYVADLNGSAQIHARPMDRMETYALPGTEGAYNPFFSPDGLWVAFYSGGKLRKISVAGGEPQTICDAAPDASGGSWGANATILFTPSWGAGLAKVPASGGTPEQVTRPGSERADRAHLWPEILPGGRAALFTSSSGGSFDDARIMLLDLRSGERRVLLEGGTNGRYAASGHLVYARGDTLLAAPFDLKGLRVTGASVPILNGVMMNASSGVAQFAFTQDGSLVYVPGGVRLAERVLVWVDRDGVDQQILADRRAFWWPRISPTGDRIAITITDGARTDIWVAPVATGSLSRLTLQGNNGVPVWSPDGSRIAFMSDRDGQWNIYWKMADGRGPDERLARSSGAQVPGSFSSDGKLLAYTELSSGSRNDIWVLPLEGDRSPRPFAQTAASEWGGSFSPTGSWLAFTSDESGKQEVYLQQYPGPGARYQVSEGGGSDPRWGPRGDEILFRDGDSVIAAAINFASQPVISGRRTLFSGRFEEATGSFPNYDVAPDGSRFVMIRTADAPQPPVEMHFVLGWFDELRRRAGRGLN